MAGNKSANPATGADQRIDGGTGADTLSGGGGSDVIEGGRGNDVIRGDQPLAEWRRGGAFSRSPAAGVGVRADGQWAWAPCQLVNYRRATHGPPTSRGGGGRGGGAGR